MFKEEINKLNPIQLNELALYFITFITIIVISYYLDGAVMVSFGLIPSLATYMYAQKLKINSQDTPKLNLLMIGIILFFAIGSFSLAILKHI